MDFLMAESWSPYLVGAGIGVLSWFSFVFSKKALGASTSFARTAGIIWKKYDKERVEGTAYFQKYTPMIDWQWMLVLGVIIGSFISAITAGVFSPSLLPAADFASPLNQIFAGRFFSALVGGILIGFGSRMAGGCTSGHGISGTLQLSISSWIAAICFFVGGIITAILVY